MGEGRGRREELRGEGDTDRQRPDTEGRDEAARRGAELDRGRKWGPGDGAGVTALFLWPNPALAWSCVGQETQQWRCRGSLWSRP